MGNAVVTGFSRRETRKRLQKHLKKYGDHHETLKTLMVGYGMSSSEFLMWMDLWATADTGDTKRIDETEFLNGLELEPTLWSQRVFSLFDTSFSRSISVIEFITVAHRLLVIDKLNTMEAAFRVVSRRGTAAFDPAISVIDGKDIATFVGLRYPHLTQARARKRTNAILLSLDNDGSGGVTFEEFVEFTEKGSPVFATLTHEILSHIRDRLFGYTYWKRVTTRLRLIAGDSHNEHAHLAKDVFYSTRHASAVAAPLTKTLKAKGGKTLDLSLTKTIAIGPRTGNTDSSGSTNFFTTGLRFMHSGAAQISASLHTHVEGGGGVRFQDTKDMLGITGTYRPRTPLQLITSRLNNTTKTDKFYLTKRSHAVALTEQSSTFLTQLERATKELAKPSNGNTANTNTYDFSADFPALWNKGGDLSKMASLDWQASGDIGGGMSQLSMDGSLSGSIESDQGGGFGLAPVMVLKVCEKPVDECAEAEAFGKVYSDRLFERQKHHNVPVVLPDGLLLIAGKY